VTINRLVRIEATRSVSLRHRKLHTGLKRLVSRKERIRIDQKGQRIRPRKMTEMKKTTRKYQMSVGLGLSGWYVGRVFICSKGRLERRGNK